MSSDNVPRSLITASRTRRSRRTHFLTADLLFVVYSYRYTWKCWFWSLKLKDLNVVEERESNIPPPFLLPPPTPPLGSVAFHALVIDREDGLPKPIRERDALIGLQCARSGLEPDRAQTEGGRSQLETDLISQNISLIISWRLRHF